MGFGTSRLALAVILFCSFSGFLGSSLFGCAGSAPDPRGRRAGNIEGNTYTYDELGIGVKLPPGWLFFPPGTLDSLLSRALEENPRGTVLDALDTGTSSVVPLFGMYSVAGENPAFANNVIALSETVSDEFLGLTSMTYAIGLRRQLNAAAGYEAARLKPQPVILGGQPVAVVTSFTADDVADYNQIYYVRVVDNHVLLIVGTESAQSPSDLDEALESIRLAR
jgi:hypothetical protein